jgi:Flp pilus assembly protein TadG
MSVEFTFTLPFFFILIFGLVKAGLLLWAQVGLQHGVELAARCASVSDAALQAGRDFTPPNNSPCYSKNCNATTNLSTVQQFAAQ